MTVNQAAAKRIKGLLKQRNMSLYRLEQNSGIQHGSMECIIKGRNKTVTLSTVIMLARGINLWRSLGHMCGAMGIGAACLKNWVLIFARTYCIIVLYAAASARSGAHVRRKFMIRDLKYEHQT